MRNGYVMIYMPEHHRADSTGYAYEHVIMAEKKLRRKLKDEEVVHHIDKNRSNNLLDNLMVFKTTADHTAFHNGCKAVLDGDVYWCPDKGHKKDNKLCPICNKNYMSYDSKMCLECYKIKLMRQRKVKRPKKEELLGLIKTTSFVKIGEMYGVSDNTIRKWCKSYNLPYRIKDMQNLNIN